MSTTVCVECNSEVPAASELCPECGFPVRPGTTSCPECLHPVLVSLDACPECGFPMEELRIAQDAAYVPRQHAGTAPAGHGGDVSNQVLQAQMESFNALAAVIAKMVDNGGSDSTRELVASLRQFVDSAENSNNEMLSDLITDIGRFVDSSEKIKDDMVNAMKEQNLVAVNSMQEIVNSFATEVRSAAGLQDAQRGAIAELNDAVRQAQSAPASAGSSKGSPYLVYLCAVMAVFTILNFFFTAYVIRLVK